MNDILTFKCCCVDDRFSLMVLNSTLNSIAFLVAILCTPWYTRGWLTQGALQISLHIGVIIFIPAQETQLFCTNDN